MSEPVYEYPASVAKKWNTRIAELEALLREARDMLGEPHDTRCTYKYWPDGCEVDDIAKKIDAALGKLNEED